MKRLLLLLIPVLALAQIHAKVEIINKTQTEYLSGGKIVSIETKTGKEAPVKLTVLDAEFAVLAKDRPVDVAKSTAVGTSDMIWKWIVIAKNSKTVITFKNDKGLTATVDPAKEDEKSVYGFIVELLKSGYKKIDVKPEEEVIIKVKSWAH